ncbi:MAG: Zn-ribbon domain-containing OB-fold protein [Ignavibacteriae bacterium]|nr:Zn-ribbon domain-containing OB-fold protein [Ignavibacteriota bacterium]
MITARYHREIPQRYRLEAAKCSSCGNISFPPRLVCPECKARKFETIKLNDEGKLITYTVIRVASDKFSKETPFAVGIVELNDGVRLTTQIADAEPEELSIGQKVRLVFRRIQEDGKAGILCYGYKAVII